MNLVPEITSKTVTLAGGLLATGAAVVAQSISTETSVGTGSFLLGGAGLIAAVSAFTKDYWTDRQKQREHEVNVLRIKLGVSRADAAVHAMYNWVRAAHVAVPTLPPVPELHLDDDAEPDKEQRDA